MFFLHHSLSLFCYMTIKAATTIFVLGNSDYFQISCPLVKQFTKNSISLNNYATSLYYTLKENSAI